MSSIDPTVKTSRVFEATIAVFDRLLEVSLPPHDLTPDVPVPVFLFHDPAWESDEYVVVETNDDPAVNDWEQVGPAAAEERIVVDVTIRAWRPKTDADDRNDAARAVIVRLEELADGVQSIAWDMSNMKPKAIGFTNERTVGRRVDVQFACGHTTEGVVGTAVVRFALVAQI